MTLREQFQLPIEALHNTSRIPATFHSHLDYEIYYFHSGKCIYLIGDKIYDLEPGDLILLNGTTLHYPKVDAQADYVRTIIHFNPSFAGQLMRPPFIEPDVLKTFEESKNMRLSLERSDRERLEPLLQRLCLLYSSTDALSHDRFLVAFTELLLLIREFSLKPQAEGSDPSSAKQASAQRVISYIEANFAEDITLEGMAAELHVNKHYLAKLFKEVTGLTPFHYLYQRRVNEAKVLFAMDRQRPVTDIAYRVGFKHGSHFSKTFKKYTGMSPDLYRKGIRPDS
ncbi:MULTISPECIES: AraC family transcriptional regulator [unclassified Paenibacillus]|uniref:AraC family transcriptional regulator n=1 Tax=unclassified Paenibacillus TaxID=185978 RepID=UPI000955E7CD|nr:MULTISPECIES: AraC family transcriptional regulator [unclassified Paenibacillus]ASS65427.1 AraC family transcriptional regulator [Paenibacillus sp. RUD330]SIQ36562.1 AraC-type DNA-binding protein [Paenibacillus sp. RU4X]SIQ58634.1 AraC-type DNA-binding protein [Paenibacillus sp. RU4T]